jgi:hypothetical protein
MHHPKQGMQGTRGRTARGACCGNEPGEREMQKRNCGTSAVCVHPQCVASSHYPLLCTSGSPSPQTGGVLDQLPWSRGFFLSLLFSALPQFPHSVALLSHSVLAACGTKSLHSKGARHLDWHRVRRGVPAWPRQTRRGKSEGKATHMAPLSGAFSAYWPAPRRCVTPLPIAIAVIAALCVPGDGQSELKSVGSALAMAIPVSVHRRACAAGIRSPGTVLRLRGRGGDSSLLGVTEEEGIVPSIVGQDQEAEERGLRFSFRELAQRRKREAAAREHEQARRDGTNSEKCSGSLEWSLNVLGH